MKCLVDTDWIIDHLKALREGRRIKNFFNQRIKVIKQDFRIRGELIVVEDVPAGVCPQCGEKVVKAEVGQRIAKLIENPERIAKAPRVTVPTIKFGKASIV